MNHTDIELRLQRLEHQVKWYRLASVLFGLALIAAAGIAANAPGGDASQDIRARRITIIDAQGKETIRLLSGPHGGVLDVLNSQGLPVIRAGASDKGGKIALADAKGEQFVQVTSEENGGELLIADKKGQKNLMRATSGTGAAPPLAHGCHGFFTHARSFNHK